jgi:hypothetical protein
VSFSSTSNLISRIFTKDFALDAQKLYLKFTAVFADYDLPLVTPLNVYAKTENWQNEKELDVRRTNYIYILFVFMILNNFRLTEEFISGLLYNMNHQNAKLDIKGTQFLRNL